MVADPDLRHELEQIRSEIVELKKLVRKAIRAAEDAKTEARRAQH